MEVQNKAGWDKRVKVIAMDDLHIQFLKGMANELGYLELNPCDTVVTVS